MGLIIRQGFKSGVVTYGAVLLGVVNNILIYPYFLELSELGEIQFVLQTSIMLVPFLVLGFTSVAAKYYPDYAESSDSRSKFLTFLLSAPLLGALLFTLFFFLFKDQLFNYYSEHNNISASTLFAVLIVSILMVFSTMLSAFAANLKRIAVPTLFNNLVKVTLPLLCIAYFFFKWPLSTLFLGIIAHYVILILLFTFYLVRLDKLRIDFSLFKELPKSKLQKILSFAVFGILAGIGTTLATKIDSFMVTTLTGSEGAYNNGVYSFALFAANTVGIPVVIVSGLATPLIAGYWKDNNWLEVDKIYKQSSINLFIIGLGIFTAIFIGIDALFEIMPKGDEYKLGKYVILIISLTKLFDLASGLNSQILSMSDKYKIFFYFLVFLSVVNIVLNWVLIPLYGINGAAIATLISITSFNFLKFIYLKVRYNLQPFSLNTIKVALIGGSIIFLSVIIPQFNAVWLNLLVRPTVALVIFVVLIYWSNSSQEINHFVQQKIPFINSSSNR